MPLRAVPRISLLGCLLGLLLPVSGGAAPPDTEAAALAAAAGKILPLALGASPLETNLRRLTDEIGGRMTGTPELQRAVRWGLEVFRAAGVEAHTEQYTIPVSWREGSARAS